MQVLDKKDSPETTTTSSPNKEKDDPKPYIKKKAVKVKDAVKNPSFRRSRSNIKLTVEKNAQSEPLVQINNDDARSDMSNRSLGLNRQKSRTATKNNFLDVMESDYLYHLGLNKLDSK